MKSPIAVIQVKPGIGDIIWHLPFVRAIAAAAPTGKVTFLAPLSSHAKELLSAEPAVDETIYFEHGGSELRRGINLLRLAALLRHNHFQSIWILDRTIRPALAAKLAGIPERIGLGLGPQKFLITNDGIDPKHFHDFPIDWLVALMATMRVSLPTVQPELHLDDATVKIVGEKFASYPRPWIVLGIGASHPDKDWPDRYWGEFLASLRRRIGGAIFLIGGADNIGRARQLAAEPAGTPVINACDLSLRAAAALLQHADLFVGTDSGPMNIAAATGTESFALFGSTKVLTNSKFIHPIVPQDGPGPGGMLRISPAQVIAAIAPYLSRRKAW